MHIISGTGQADISCCCFDDTESYRSARDFSVCLYSCVYSCYCILQVQLQKTLHVLQASRILVQHRCSVQGFYPLNLAIPLAGPSTVILLVCNCKCSVSFMTCSIVADFSNPAPTKAAAADKHSK